MTQAIEYRDRFLRSLSKAKKPDVIIFEFAQEMVADAVEQVKINQPTTPEEVANIFQIQIDKWHDVCLLLHKYPLVKDGLLQILKKKQPQFYFLLIQHGLERLKEDESTEESDGTPA